MVKALHCRPAAIGRTESVGRKLTKRLLHIALQPVASETVITIYASRDANATIDAVTNDLAVSRLVRALR